MNRRAVLLVGGTSAIGRAIAREMAARGARLHLGARDRSEVERISADLRTRYGVPATWSVFEAGDFGSHAGFLAGAIAELGGLDIVVVAVGELGDQVAAEGDFAEARRIIDANYTGVLSLLTEVAGRMEHQRHGAIAVLCSVAGDRGRRSNYFYGSAKAGLDRYLQGLRSRLLHSGVHVLTVKPGLIDTRMTFDRPASVLIANPRRVALATVRGLRHRRNVIYVPWYWFWLMLGVRAVPESLFKRVNL